MPVLSVRSSTMDPQLLQMLLGELSTLASVYHLPPSVRTPADQASLCALPWPSLTVPLA